MFKKIISGVTKPYKRFAVALGGFLIFIGIIFTGFFLIDLLGVINFSSIESEVFQSFVLIMSLIIGLIDLLVGIILWRR